MTNTVQYKCPHCGAHIEFDSALQRMKCPYCDSEFTPDEAAAGASRGNGGTAFEERAENSGSRWSAEESEKFAVYTCTSCGAELITDENTAATKCPYCDNVIVLSGRVSGELKPDLIIPFKVSRAESIQALGKHFHGKKLLPKVFSSEAHLEEVKGVYVPFWLYDSTAEGTGEYKMTRVRTWADKNYRYTETSHFAASRRGEMDFRNVPVDGLKDLSDDLMESIEGFDPAQAVPFRQEYLSGFYANRYDLDSDGALVRASERMRETLSDELQKTVTGYATVSKVSGSSGLRGTRVRYALYPVWLLTTSWRGQSYLFAMNAQTGKFVGNLPIDKGRYWKRRGFWFLLFTVILYFVLRYLISEYGF